MQFIHLNCCAVSIAIFLQISVIEMAGVFCQEGENWRALHLCFLKQKKNTSEKQQQCLCPENVTHSRKFTNFVAASFMK